MSTGPLDRGKEAIRAIIRIIMADVVYYMTSSASVVSQEGDGTCTITPTSPLFPGMKGVRIRCGVPGVTLKINAGSLVDFTFENGDPKKPIITGWSTADLDSISLTAGNDISFSSTTVNLVPNGQPIARQSDLTAVGGPAMVPVVCNLIVTSPVPCPGPVGAAAIAPGTPIICTMQIMTPAYGSIVSGNPTAKS